MKTFDFISYQPSLFAQGNKRFRTIFGSITQIIFAILNTSGILYFSKDIYYKLNPNVIESTFIVDNPPEWIVTPSDFNFIFSMNDPDNYGPYKNSSIYTVDFYMTIIENGILKEYRQLSSESCSLDNFKGVDPGIFSPTFPFEQYYCISKNETLSLKGVLTSTSISYFKFMVRTCKNETSPVPCATEEELSKKLDGTMVTLYHIDKIYDPSNYTHPVKHFFNNYWLRASQKVFNGVSFYFKTVNFIDDTGLLFEDSSKSTTLKVDNIHPSIDFMKSDHFLEVIFLFNNSVTTYNRKYKRFQQVVAEIGGLINAAYIFFSVIVNYFTQLFYFDHIVNKLFDSSKELRTLNSACVEASINNNLRSANEISLSPVIHFESNPIVQDQLRRLRIEPKNNFKRVESKQNRKILFEKIKELMDYENFIKRFKEIELLKYLVLNDEGSRKVFKDLIESRKSSSLLLTDGIVVGNDSIGSTASKQLPKNNILEALTKLKKILDKA
jgi:hypothetical protein